MLIVNVLGSSRLDGFEVVEDLGGIAEGDSPQPVLDLVEAYRGLSERRAVECYHDAIQAHEQAQALFAVGFLSLADRGLVERLFWKTCSALRDIARAMPKVPEELEQLETALADIYFCNFSVFQSLPDSWAIDQIFPIVPIHRLDEKPTRTGVLADMTCDSDGQIDRFVGERDIERALPLHELREGEDYYLGVFLTGAYQETLGDLHNLFGDTHVIHVALDGEGRWEADEIVAGDTAAKVLGYLQYDVDALLERLGASCRRAAEEGVLSHDEAGRIVDFYRQELEGYTYLEPENAP
jgi:arginine decarboxylase